MSCDHWICAVITRQILWSQKMLITRHILRSLNMSCDHRICCGITWYFLWSQDVSCDHETCRVITEYVLWSLDIFCVQWICRVTTRLYTQIMCYGYRTCFGLLDISCDHRICRGITWKFLWSQDVSWDHKLCRVMTEYVLWSLDLFCGRWKCRVIIRHVFWSWGMSYDHNMCPVIARCGWQCELTGQPWYLENSNMCRMQCTFKKPPVGIEPTTVRLRSACSANWAKEAYVEVSVNLKVLIGVCKTICIPEQYRFVQHPCLRLRWASARVA